MIHTFVYYGLSLNSLSVDGNSKLNFILVSLVEIPGYIATLIFTDWLGRRASLFAALAVSGTSCLAFHFVTSGKIYTTQCFWLVVGEIVYCSELAHLVWCSAVIQSRDVAQLI